MSDHMAPVTGQTCITSDSLHGEGNSCTKAETSQVCIISMNRTVPKFKFARDFHGQFDCVVYSIVMGFLISNWSASSYSSSCHTLGLTIQLGIDYSVGSGEWDPHIAQACMIEFSDTFLSEG